MDDKVKIRAVRSTWNDRLELLIKQGSSYGVSIVMEERELGSYIEPTVMLSINDGQTLMDDLWYAGLRPSEGTGSAGSLRATEKHLEDMRTIVFKKLGIDC